MSKMFIPKGFIPPQHPTYEQGYAQAIEDAVKAIEASVSFTETENTSEALINCRLQCAHDARVVRALLSKGKSND